MMSSTMSSAIFPQQFALGVCITALQTDCRMLAVLAH